MKIELSFPSSGEGGYAAARVRSLFNCAGESAEGFRLSAELPDSEAWRGIGVVHGPSGSGKTALAEALINRGDAEWWNPVWPDGPSIVDVLTQDSPFDAVTAALSSVGLGTVPSWLRPYRVLSNGEKFRANLAGLILSAPSKTVVIDEFTSVLDRRIARVGAAAAAKAWRRAVPDGRLVLLTPHEDVLDWLDPDWSFDTVSGRTTVGRGRRRPPITLDIVETGWGNWPLFEPHHYLKLPHMIAARCYVGIADGVPAAHLAVSTRPGLIEARACRLVVMPEWRGIGVGTRFLNAVCDAWLRGDNPFSRPLRTLFHTSHPGLAAALRRGPAWTQVSAAMGGSNKARSAASIAKSAKGAGAGYGGHLRAVQGFRYLGLSGGPA